MGPSRVVTQGVGSPHDIDGVVASSVSQIEIITTSQHHNIRHYNNVPLSVNTRHSVLQYIKVLSIN